MRRLYFLFPDVPHCQQMVNELLLQYIDIKHMHAVANDNVHLGSLPEASIFQKSDFRHSVWMGFVVGIFLGIIIGLAVHFYLDIEWGIWMFIIPLIIAFLSAWGASMIGIMSPNVELDRFNKAFNEGKILLIVDVPKDRVHEIEAIAVKLHPEAKVAGMEPTIPPFP